MNGVTIIPTKIVTGRPLIVGAFQIVAGWWGHQPGQTAMVGVLTDHSFKMEATIWNAPLIFVYWRTFKCLIKSSTGVSFL